MQQTGRQVIVAVALLVFVGVVAMSGGVVAEPGVLAQQSTPTDNTTVQHENPESVSEAGDAQQVSQWLQGRLTGQLQGSAVEISQGEYERARELTGGEYDSRLEQFVDVAGETDSEADDQAAETFRETRDNQREYANATQSYSETYEQYQDARESGDIATARESARELERTADRIEELNGSLNTNYRTLENQTGTDTSDARNAISNTTQDVRAQQQDVRSETLVETTLTVDTDGPEMSFNDPLAITGQLQATDGTPIANESVQIIVFEQTYQAQTDANGQFTLQYRPVDLPVDTTSVAIQYIPTGASPYLGTETNATVDVTQVSPSLTATTQSSQVGYGDTVTTNVTATIDGEPVPALPIRAVLGGISERDTTTNQGQVTLRQRVPARVPAGDRAVRIAHNREDRAVGPATADVPVTITTTETALTTDATARNDEVIARGRLTTDDNGAVANQTVEVTASGRTQAAETNQTGWYQVTVEGSNIDVQDTSVVQVTARFDGAGTNLESSTARTTVDISSVAGAGENQGNSVADTVPNQDSLVELLGAGLVALVILTGAIALSRRDTGTDSPATTTAEQSDSDAETGESDKPSMWIEQAQAALTNGELEQATVAAYGSGRDYVEERTDLVDTLTHREFLQAAETHLTDSDTELLSTLANAYERVTFVGTADNETATSAVEAASTLVSADDAESEQQS